VRTKHLPDDELRCDDQDVDGVRRVSGKQSAEFPEPTTLAVNLVGPFRLTRVLAGPMVLAGSGTIVNISSDAAVQAYPKWGAYGVSKAALDHLGRIWAAELEGTGVRVLTIDPGEMNTRMHADAVPDADPATLQDPLAVARRIVDRIEGGAYISGARLEAPVGGAS
jgi:NAD(P)-dependent dehydrogenase (short-subunit alcohol dehydrogenase family)